ncbi:MAG: dihydropteroate synthase [Chromatiaceae bacterium]|jgi:dihydropteroate synthase|nr:dihydropteroate synthase [Chromatiaceae bacterium]
MILDCAGRLLDLSRPRVMGILNVTPDSFSDGGRFAAPDDALAQAERMVLEGADVLDVGGESTRPGAAAVSLDEEIARVLPVIERLRAAFDVPISIDTSKPGLMQAAVAAGAGMINDVSALRAPGAIEVAAAAGVPVCLMHMRGDPRSMQAAPKYGNVVADIIEYLGERVASCEAGGIARERLLVDPGFGFGKALEHNLVLLRDLHEFSRLGLPVLVGISRKSMLGMLTGRPVEQRVAASVAAAVMAVERGAQIVRVHDVAATVDALKLWQAVVAV